MPSAPTSVKPIEFTGDVRVTLEYATLNGKKYHYVNANPTKPERGVALLLHGWPELWYCWRYVIPFLQDEGFRVVTPDLLGYGGTDKPQCPYDDPRPYTLKNMSDDLAELLKQLNIPKAVIIGHDWGAALAIRFALWKPALVSHIATIAVPFVPPQPIEAPYVTDEHYFSLFPNFLYQKSFIDPKLERALTGPPLENLLKMLFNPKPEEPLPDDYKAIINQIDVDQWIEFLKTKDASRSDMIDEEELKVYVDALQKGTFHGPFNWYRARKQNFDDEKSLTTRQIQMPALFIQTLEDAVLTKSFVKRIPQEYLAPNLTRRSISTAHWAMMEDPDAVNATLKEWFDGVVFGNNSKL